MAGVGIGIIGAGNIARAHARAVADHPEARLIAVSDPDGAAAQALAHDWGDGSSISVSDCRETLLSTPGVDAVVVCAPTSFHHEITLDAISRGRHVLVEKPFAVSVAQAREMIAAAGVAGTQLMSGQTMRFMPIFTWAKEFISMGGLGAPVQSVERRLTLRREGFPWWGELPHFLVSHWGSHSLDLLSFLLVDEFAFAYCRGISVDKKRGVVDDFNLHAEFSQGARVGVHMSFTSRSNIHDLVLIGEDATLEFSCYKSVRLNGAQVLCEPEDEMLRAAFYEQLDNFIQSIYGREELRSSGASVLPSMAVLDAASDSMRSGKVERVMNVPGCTPAC